MQVASPNPGSTPNRLNAASILSKSSVNQTREEELKNFSRIANETYLQQPTQGQQKSIRVSDDVDLDLYSSPTKGITPMSNMLAAIASRESLRDSMQFKNQNVESPKERDF